MSDDVFLPHLETLNECALVVRWCESGSREKDGKHYQTEMGRISTTHYRYAKQKLMAAELDDEKPSFDRAGRVSDHDYGLLIDLADQLPSGKSVERAEQLAKSYFDRTGLRISPETKRLRLLERWSRKNRAE